MKLNKIDLNKIQVFAQVVESGNYRRASERLHVTPSALSQSVVGLERSLGFELFHRRGRRMVLSAEGQRLHREFRAAHASLLGALREIGGREEKVDGVLRIGAYFEFAKARLCGLLREFSSRYPEAAVKLRFDSPSRLHQALDHGSLDLCISIFPAREKKRIRSSILCSEELVLVAPKAGLPGAPSLEELLRQPVIDYYDKHEAISRWCELHYRRRPKRVQVRIYAATAEMLLALAREGAGIGVVPEYLTRQPHAMRGLRVLRPSGRRLLDHLWLLEPSGSERQAAREAFRQLLLHEFPLLRRDPSAPSSPSPSALPGKKP